VAALGRDQGWDVPLTASSETALRRGAWACYGIDLESAAIASFLREARKIAGTIRPKTKWAVSPAWHHTPSISLKLKDII